MFGISIFLCIFAFKITYKTKCKFTNKIEINKLKFKIMKRYHIWLNGKVVADRNTEKGARKCASDYCRKYPANEGNVVFIYDMVDDVEL